MKHCMYCGTLMNDDAIYCPKCGRKQDNHIDNSHINHNITYTRPAEKRGTVSLVWGWIFIVASIFMPIVGNIISILLGFHLRKYPERKSVSTTIIIIATVVGVLYNFTGYASGFWNTFFKF